MRSPLVHSPHTVQKLRPCTVCIWCPCSTPGPGQGRLSQGMASLTRVCLRQLRHPIPASWNSTWPFAVPITPRRTPSGGRRALGTRTTATWASRMCDATSTRRFKTMAVVVSMRPTAATSASEYWCRAAASSAITSAARLASQASSGTSAATAAVLSRWL